ncbi:MAG: site-2 protease family protein [Acidilobaceae archaeon]|nr:site-2 protease family protein [Acidilobaceae archaeon]
MEERIAAFLVALAAFWALVWVTLRGKSNRVQVYPLLLVWRFGRSQEAYPKGLRASILSFLGWPSVALMVILQAAFYYLAVQMFIARYFSPQPPPASGFVPFLPGVTVPLDINLIIVLISIGLAVLVHELGHALMARAVGVKVKDFGLVLLAFIPGAFVEPDEEELKKAPLSARAKIYSGGVAANIALALLAAPLLILASSSLASGVVIVEVEQGSPAEQGGLREGAVVVEVNGERVRSVSEFVKVLDAAGTKDPNVEALLRMKVMDGGGERELVIVKPKGQERIGIAISQSYEGGSLAVLALTTLNAIVAINIALTLVNAAPIFLPTPAGALVTDGAHLLGDLVARLWGERAKFIVSSAVGIATLLLVISLLTLTPIRFLP